MPAVLHQIRSPTRKPRSFKRENQPLWRIQAFPPVSKIFTAFHPQVLRRDVSTMQCSAGLSDRRRADETFLFRNYKGILRSLAATVTERPDAALNFAGKSTFC
ncbi:MAG: hypothetical protein R3C40_09875 [Parvularculaceae bacterium]